MYEWVPDGNWGVDAMGQGAGCGGWLLVGRGRSGWGFGVVVSILKPFYYDDADGFLLRKVSVYVYNANGEETRFVAQSGPCALVNVYGAVRSEAVQDPEVA